MENNKSQNNVIQFPGKKREAEPTQPSATTPPPVPSATATPQKRTKKQKATLAGSVLAILFATGAVNHYAFEVQSEGSRTLASESGRSGRAIASVDSANFVRDAKWEMAMAESLAKPKGRDIQRDIQSLHIGHSPTLEEKLRLGTLDDVKYTFLKPDSGEIHAITLQGSGSEPDYIGDRGQFLKEYGSLFEAGFASAELKAIEMSDDRTVEQYTLFDKDQRPTAEANFELDKHKRLLSLKVEPLKI